LIGETRKARIQIWVGGGKVEIQKQDSHFTTAPAACGNKEEKPGRLRRPKGGHFYRGKNGDISKEA
jgi:hypothetical protein